MLLWVKTQILTFLDLGGRIGKSSTVTDMSQHHKIGFRIPQDPTVTLWHCDPKNQ